MDSVSANFFVGVFRALAIDFVREFAPHFGSSRFGLESRRFAANYRWRCLQVLWHADGELQYRILEQANDSNLLQSMDVEQFGELTELQFDSIQLIGGAAEKKRGSVPDFPVDWRYGPGWVKESDENAIISVIQKSAIAKCHVVINDYNEFTSRHFLEPIFDRITALECFGVGQVMPPCDQDPRRMESFLKDLAQKGKMKKVKLHSCLLSDPNLYSSLFRCCSESSIVYCNFSTLEFAKTLFRELLALAEERRPEPWSAVYFPLLTTNSHLLLDFFVSEGFQKRPEKKWTHDSIYTKTIGGIEVKFGYSLQGIAVGCDLPEADPPAYSYYFPTRSIPLNKSALAESRRRLEEVEKERLLKEYKIRLRRY